VEAGALQLPSDPHFLWITEFPLFTRSDEDKEVELAPPLHGAHV
jgi:aspartyl-tRNA synthetase